MFQAISNWRGGEVDQIKIKGQYNFAKINGKNTLLLNHLSVKPYFLYNIKINQKVSSERVIRTRITTFIKS